MAAAFGQHASVPSSSDVSYAYREQVAAGFSLMPTTNHAFMLLNAQHREFL